MEKSVSAEGIVPAKALGLGGRIGTLKELEEGYVVRGREVGWGVAGR